MSRFPDFNKWHRVPKDADIPAQTPYFKTYNGALVSYFDAGWSAEHPKEDRDPDYDYYTEDPILSPNEEKIEKRARDMFYAVGGTGWEYIGEHDQEMWLDLARKYVEKED